MTSGTETASKDVAAYLARRREDVDRALERLLPGRDVWPEHLHRAIRHSVFAGGKRLRPILCLTAGEVLGARTEDLLEAACGLEMIHTYSLIHDDLPALDNDDLRRGVPTCHVVFGEATAILAGDALLTHGLGAVRAATRKASASRRPRSGSCRRSWTRSGRTGMIGGQAADLEAEKEAAPDGRARREDPREQDGPADPGLALGGRHPRRRRRGDPRAHRPLRPRRSASRSRSRTTCSTSSPTPPLSARRRERTRRPARRPFRGSGASSGRGRSWPRTSRRRSRRPRRFRAAGASCRSSPASSGPESREGEEALPCRVVARECLSFSPERGGLRLRRPRRSVTRADLYPGARPAGGDPEREPGHPVRRRSRGFALSEGRTVHRRGEGPRGPRGRSRTAARPRRSSSRRPKDTEKRISAASRSPSWASSPTRFPAARLVLKIMWPLWSLRRL